MARFVLRVWLPDRPGALGELATRLGEAGGDLIGIAILERDGGFAVDEITVATSDDAGEAALADAVARTSAARLEDLRPATERLPYPGADALSLAVELSRSGTVRTLAGTVVHGAGAVFAADWVALVDSSPQRRAPLTAGEAPPAGWLSGFLSGVGAQRVPPGEQPPGPGDVAWAFLEASCTGIVVGREGPPFRSRERRQLAELAVIADCRWRELRGRRGGAHPSRSAAPFSDRAS